MVANVITELDDTPVDFAAAGPNARSYVQVNFLNIQLNLILGSLIQEQLIT